MRTTQEDETDKQEAKKPQSTSKQLDDNVTMRMIRTKRTMTKMTTTTTTKRGVVM